MADGTAGWSAAGLATADSSADGGDDWASDVTNATAPGTCCEAGSFFFKMDMLVV